MAAERRTWRPWLAAVVVLAAVAAGLWLAYARGWLRPAEERLRHLTAKRGAAEKGGMDRGNMPEMEMGPMAGGGEGPFSKVPGYAALTVAPELQQRIGVTTGRVELAPLKMSVRTVGIVRPDETKVAHIHLRTEGWVQELFVAYTGQAVKKDDPLLSIYSPEFLRTQVDYVTARRTERTRTLATGSQSLADLSLKKLELLDVPPQEIRELEQTGKPREYLTLRSPIAGTVLEKNVFEKEYVDPKRELYVVADLSTVWVQAKVYEYELPHVELGMPARVSVAALPARQFAGKVVFVQPMVEEATRTIQVRVELPNQDGVLKPGMFGDIEIAHVMGDGLLVPTSAVIRTGERDIAFRVEEDNRLVPVEVQIGAVKFGDRFQVLKGLNAGDRVVTSANFLIDSESRLREGGGNMAGMAGMDMGEMKGKGGMDMKESSKGQASMPGKARGGMRMEGMDHSKMKH